MTHLPHDPYITAVTTAIAIAGITIATAWTSDTETRGEPCYLTAVIALDPSSTQYLPDEDIPADAQWPHGLLLMWEWHTGRDIEERGPTWTFTEFNADHPHTADLPVHGYASPAAIVEAVRLVIARSISAGSPHNAGSATWDGKIVGDTWDRADGLETAVTAWAAE